MKTGRIHFLESMALVDGPGIRSVVFMQGCRLRCQYCHNPDTWKRNGSCKEMTSEELVQKLMRFKGYYGQSGGVTISGGEPLLQLDFVTEVFSMLKKAGIHTCLDTAGVADPDEPDLEDRLRMLLNETDLVLLDVKHEDPSSYKEITGNDITDYNRFLAVLQDCEVPIWIRHVVVPGLTDGEEHIRQLKKYISDLKNVTKIELLPYHTMGVDKYKTLGLSYRLDGVPALSSQDVRPLEQMLMVS